MQQLPDSTMVAFGFTGGGDAVDSLWQKLGDLAESQGEVGPGGLDELSGQIEARLRHRPARRPGGAARRRADARARLRGVRTSIPATGAPDPSTINLGARMRTDADAVRDLIGTGAGPGGPHHRHVVRDLRRRLDDGIVLASNDDYAQALADGGDLGDSDVFESAVADADSATLGVLPRPRQGGRGRRPDRRRDRCTRSPARRPRRSTCSGPSAPPASVDGDYTRTTMRLVFD